MSADKGPRVAIGLRVPRYLQKRMQAEADKAKVDLNTWINRCLLAKVKDNDSH